jgi:hypothetical protein
MSGERRIAENAAEITEEEIAAASVDELTSRTAGVAEMVAADDLTEGVAEIAGTRYKVVNLIGKFCSPNGNWDTSVKDWGVVGHYNGPPVAAWAWEKPLEWIQLINDLHARPGRFSPGWTFDGIAYHEFVVFDTVYRLREYGATLPHCGNLSWNYHSLALHIPVGGSQRPSDSTYRTFFARVTDHLEAMRLGRGNLVGHREVDSSHCPGDEIQSAVGSYRAGRNPGGDPVPGPRPAPKPTPKPSVTWINCVYHTSDPEAKRIARAMATALNLKEVGLPAGATPRNLKAVIDARTQEGVYAILIGERAIEGVKRHRKQIEEAAGKSFSLDATGWVQTVEGDLKTVARWRIAALADEYGADKQRALDAYEAAL